MFKYKIDVQQALKDVGYSSYRIRQEGTINQTALTKIRNGEMPPWNVFDKLCRILHLQPGDIIEWIDQGSDN